MKSFINKFAVVAAFVSLTSSAMAAPISLDMVWSGASFGNGATARGTLVLDTNYLIGDFRVIPADVPGISLDITVAGGTPGAYATSYDKSTFLYVLFMNTTALDYSKELIGQILPNNCAFGTSRGDCGNGAGGDFNFISKDFLNPTGTYFFEFTHPSGETMLLTSVKQTGVGEVPEPASLALFGLALAGAAVARRKQASGFGLAI